MSLKQDQHLVNLLFEVEKSIKNRTFIQLILSKRRNALVKFKKSTITPYEHKGTYSLSQTSLSETQSFTNNIELDQLQEAIVQMLEEDFQEAYFWTSTHRFSLRVSKKGKTSLKKEINQDKVLSSLDHNRKKNLPDLDPDLMRILGMTNANGTTKTGQKSKRNQVRRFVQLVEENLTKYYKEGKSGELRIVDMGSGSAYLSLLLFNYLKNAGYPNVCLTGVERRSDLVQKCQLMVEEQNFGEHVSFKCCDILDWRSDIGKIEVLIALHACDQATDHAIYQGIKNDAELIFCSPCCHKELRSKINAEDTWKELFKYGKHSDKLSEIITDTLRTLYLNKWGYKTRVLEFVSSEHSAKNSLIIANKINITAEHKNLIQRKIETLQSQFHIESFSLENLLKQL